MVNSTPYSVIYRSLERIPHCSKRDINISTRIKIGGSLPKVCGNVVIQFKLRTTHLNNSAMVLTQRCCQSLDIACEDCEDNALFTS